MSDKFQNPLVILRLKDVQRQVGLSRSAIYARLADDDFPRPIQLGPRAVGWLQADIEEWIDGRTRKARNATNAISGLTPINKILPDVLKEVARRTELRPRLEAELGRQLSDDEFLAIADQQGGRL
jgi:prophage regulatory protein